MHFNERRQEIVHRNQPYVLAIALVAIQAEELWQQRTGILIEVHIVARQKFLQELALLVLDGLDDELIVVGQIEYGSGRTRIRQFT